MQNTPAQGATKGRISQPAKAGRRDNAISVAVDSIQLALFHANPADVDLVERNLAFLRKQSTQTPDVLMAGAFSQASCYFDAIGDLKRAVEIGKSGVEFSARGRDLGSIRRAHNVAGVNHSRLCNFSNACRHFEVALKYAVDLNDQKGEMSVLANVGALLDNIGLIALAKQVAVRVSHFPSSPGELDHIHFQNAANALRCCADTSDRELGAYFYEIARRTVKTGAQRIDELTHTYFESNSVEYFLAIGDNATAYKYIKLILSRQRKSANVRIHALAAVALARYRKADRDVSGIKKSIRALSKLQPALDNFAVHYEDILSLLVHLCLDAKLSAEADGYARDLRNYLVKTKHREFFCAVRQQPLTSIAAIDTPVHTIPSSILSTSDDEITSSNSRYEARMDLAIRPLRGRSQTQPGGRNAIEDWAVAAELSNGYDGSHCFKVGALVNTIYQLVGYDEETAAAAGVAARLHDIGKMGLPRPVDGQDRRISLGDWFVTREHCLLGFDLLVSCGEGQEWQLAASMARHHHEWWNGCGLPDGKRGEDIPFGARVCAVANCLVSFVEGPDGWSLASGLEQIRAMSGMQLDPDLVDAVVGAFEKGEIAWNSLGDEQDFETNGLVASKRALIAAIDLPSPGSGNDQSR